MEELFSSGSGEGPAVIFIAEIHGRRQGFVINAGLDVHFETKTLGMELWGLNPCFFESSTIHCKCQFVLLEAL